MLELQRILSEYREQGRDASGIPVFDETAFKLGRYSDGAVLKFRGIIRDVLDPELVLLSDAAEAVDAVVGATAHEIGDKFVERVPLKVALVPYVNEWAAERYLSMTRKEGGDRPAVSHGDASVQAGKGTKRPIEGEDGDGGEDLVAVNEADAAKKAKPTTGDEKMIQETQVEPSAAFSEAVVSIYVYDEQYGDLATDAFKVNESFEFTGVLDMMVVGASNSAVTYDEGFTEQAIAELTISDCLEGIQRKQQSSVVLHCCGALKLDAFHFVRPHELRQYYNKFHSNPTRRELLSSCGIDLANAREALIKHLARAAGGDELAAEYMLLCLLSRVYSRPDHATALGNLSVNLSFSTDCDAAATAAIIDQVTATLRTLMPMLATIDMSIKSLNETKFLPHKDYENDVLRGGVLQFAHGTAVVVNETALSAGNLNDQGVKNVGALQSLVEKMLLPYDFQYYSMDFPQDVAVLSLSQGKSILPVHISIPVQSSPASTPPASEELIDSFRLLLAVLRSLDVRLGNEQAEIAEKHYVECRKAKQDVSAEDLHRWLRIARLVALSRGEDDVSKSSWQHMLDIEHKRILRLDELANTQ